MGQLLFSRLKLTPNIGHGGVEFERFSNLFDTLCHLTSIRSYNKSKLVNIRESDLKSLDLAKLPPELSFYILSFLNATDLYLAGCVWWNLASDELLWQGLCQATWPFCSAYKTWTIKKFSFRQLYLQLDEARLTFNSDAFEGIHYLQSSEILTDDAQDLAMYLHTSPGLNFVQKRRFLVSRPDVLDGVIRLQDFHKQFLPNAMRKLFTELPTPQKSPDAFVFVTQLIEKFSKQFVLCNPTLGLQSDIVYLLCFSLLMLSVDLSCPQIKNKMSKREFIRNTRNAVPLVNSEFLGHLYDNVYLEGHVAAIENPDSTTPDRSGQRNRPFHVLASN